MKRQKIVSAYIICPQHGIADVPHGSIGPNSNNNSSCPAHNHYCTLEVKIHLFNGSKEEEKNNGWNFQMKKKHSNYGSLKKRNRMLLI